MQPLFLEKGIKNKLKGRDETHRVEIVGWGGIVTFWDWVSWFWAQGKGTGGACKSYKLTSRLLFFKQPDMMKDSATRRRRGGEGVCDPLGNPENKDPANPFCFWKVS